jgi:hypothetical protein
MVPGIRLRIKDRCRPPTNKVISFHADESGRAYTYPAVKLYGSNLVGVHGGDHSGVAVWFILISNCSRNVPRLSPPSATFNSGDWQFWSASLSPSKTLGSARREYKESSEHWLASLSSATCPHSQSPPQQRAGMCKPRLVRVHL